MALSFVFGLGFLLLLLLLPGVLLVGRDSKARRLLASIVIGFAVVVLILIAVAKPCEIVGIC
jgi:ABC-type microcin C transport system permease subunit YejE